MIIMDAESDGLLDTATQIHCVVFKNTENNRVQVFTQFNLNELPDFMNKCPALCGHNCIGYDFPLLKKILGYEYKGRVYDTLIMSRIFWPDKPGKAPHSVEVYGQEFGLAKVENEDWSVFTEHMLERCKIDVDIQHRIWDKIQNHIEELSVRDSRITNASILNVFDLEFKVFDIIEQQARNGFAFNLPLAYELIERLNVSIKAIEDKLLPNMPIKVIRPAEKETKAFTGTKAMSAIALRWWNENSSKLPEKLVPDIAGDFSKVKFEQFNLSSSVQVKDYLTSKGWKPTNWNYKKDKYGKPIRDNKGHQIKMSPILPKTAEEWETVAEQVKDNNIGLLAEYNKANHRKSQIEGLINNLRPDHRIEAQANTCGTNTARMKHRIVVNIPKADDKIYFGKEMRSLFIAAPGKVLVGVDAKALEARIEAHYIHHFDPVGARELLEGDIHSINAKAFGVSRSLAKNGKYALTYGCSESKLAKTLGKPNKDAKRLYQVFWEANPGLKELKDRVEEVYDRNGYLLALDGRPLTIRYKHALINTLFQSAGSIVMKRALVIANERLKGFTFKFVGNFHDEAQAECNPGDADQVGQILCDSIREAGEYYNLNVPMEGEYKIGLNWAETH